VPYGQKKTLRALNNNKNKSNSVTQFSQISNERLKSGLKTGRNGDAVTSDGRLFQTQAAATPKAWSPTVTQRVGGMFSSSNRLHVTYACTAMWPNNNSNHTHTNTTVCIVSYFNYYFIVLFYALLILFIYIIMVALCNRADHYIFILFLLLSFFFFFPRLVSAVGDWMFTILWHMVWP